MIFECLLIAVVGALGWGIRGVMGGMPGAFIPGVVVGVTMLLFTIPAHPANFVLVIVAASGLCGLFPYAVFIDWAVNRPFKKTFGVGDGIIGYTCTAVLYGITMTTVLRYGLRTDTGWLIIACAAVGGLSAILALVRTNAAGYVAPWKLLEFVTGAFLYAGIYLALAHKSIVNPIWIDEETAKILIALILIFPVFSILNRFIEDRAVPSFDLHYFLIVYVVACLVAVPFADSNFGGAACAILFLSVYMFFGEIKMSLFGEHETVRIQFFIMFMLSLAGILLLA